MGYTSSATAHAACFLPNLAPTYFGPPPGAPLVSWEAQPGPLGSSHKAKPVVLQPNCSQRPAAAQKCDPRSPTRSRRASKVPTPRVGGVGNIGGGSRGVLCTALGTHFRPPYLPRPSPSFSFLSLPRLSPPPCPRETAPGAALDHAAIWPQVGKSRASPRGGDLSLTQYS